MESNGGEMETLVSPRVSDLERRADVDTSAPFESVREAVDRFGGSALWKSQLKQLFPSQNHYAVANNDARILKEQAAQLEIDLAKKRKENSDILKELETTKKIVNSLKLKILNQACESSDTPETNIHPSFSSTQSPKSILMELKQAKLNLNKTTIDINSTRSSIETLIKKVAKEKALLEKTCENLSTNRALVSSLQKELQDAEEMKKLTSEIDKYKKMKEKTKSEETKLITLPVEEYNELKRKAKEAEDISRKKVEGAMDEVERAYKSRNQLLKKVEKAEAEIRSSRVVLEEALIRVEKGDNEKLAVEASLRKWRCEQVQKRRYIHSSPKFKNTGYQCRRELKNIDLNKRTLSIGQILSQKLLGPEDYDDNGLVVDENSTGNDVLPRVSLGQILSKKQRPLSPQPSVACKSYSMKRKKFGFAAIPLLKTKQGKKAKED